MTHALLRHEGLTSRGERILAFGLVVVTLTAGGTTETYRLMTGLGPGL